MNARQRVLAAMAHRQPDRVPVDLGGMRSTGISAIAYAALKRHLALPGGHTRVYDVVQQLAQPEDDILDRFHVDVVDLGRYFNTEDGQWRTTQLADGSPAQYPAWFRPIPAPDGSWKVFAQDGTEIAVMPRGMHFFDQSCFPYLDGYPADYRGLPGAMAKVSWGALPSSPWDRAGELDFWDKFRQGALELRRRTDRAIMVACGCNLFEWGAFLRRIDNFLMDLAAEPDEVQRFLDALMERHLESLDRVCRAVGDVADLIQFGDDLGTSTGPFMSVNTYRQFFKPRQKQLCDFVKRNSGMRVFLHSCGSIHAFLPDMIDAGIDVINPVQTNCRDMEPERLKREFGNDITFWGGGCDTRTVLPRGTPGEVKDHVKRRLEILAPGGGFVFNTVHNILPDVPPANIVAMYEAVEEFNR
jgi:uroporphyrinogen decarboxylase